MNLRFSITICFLKYRKKLKFSLIPTLIVTVTQMSTMAKTQNLPTPIYYGISYYDETMDMVRFQLEPYVISTVEELFWMLNNKYKSIVDGFLPGDNVITQRNESLGVIRRFSKKTSELKPDEIDEVKAAINKYNSCYPRWFFTFSNEKPNDLPRFTKEVNGKNINYNEMYANFVTSSHFIDRDGLLLKLIMYCACKSLPGFDGESGFEEYSKRIIGFAIQRTLVAEVSKKHIDYRFFTEGYCVRIWFDNKITENDMKEITQKFKKTFISIYCSSLRSPNIILRSCGFFK